MPLIGVYVRNVNEWLDNYFICLEEEIVESAMSGGIRAKASIDHVVTTCLFIYSIYQTTA